MSALSQCTDCGTELRDTEQNGLCTPCLLSLGLTVAGDSTDSKAAPVPLNATDTPLVSGLSVRHFGDYELLEEIARGGMGIVYKARQVSLGRNVALKMILAGQFAAKEFVQRFRGEAAAAAILQHPNIVAIHEVGIHDNQHFFSMDFVEGRNLAQLVGNRPLSPRKAARYIKLIAEAIHYAHQQGILHRDLKPSNVLIDAATDQPRVTDFGLARRLDGESSLTVTGQVLGSPNFMPPEQASGSRGKVGRHSDVYGLGGILYHLLTARAPFQAESLEGIVTQVLNTEPLPPRLLNPVVPHDLETICLKCLEKEPAKRYPTAQALADELDRFLNHEPIHARPLGKLGKAWRWCRRNSGLAGSLGTALLLLLIVAIGGPIAAFRINKARKAGAQEKLRTQRHLYASDMNLAQQSLKLNNLGKARRLLDRHRPQPGEEDLRGWEWRYLWQLSRSSALVTLTNRPEGGYSASFSSDGTRLAVGWEGGRVELWDVPGRRLVRALTDRENLRPGRVAFSPVRNLLAATSESKVVALYDLDSGRESILWRARNESASEVRDLAFSQDGSRVVIYAGSTPEIGDEVWVVNVISTQIESHHLTVWSPYFHLGAARLSPDNQRLYLARSDYSNYRYSIQCLDLATGKELWQTESQRDYGLTALAISPDGRVLASGSAYEDPTIRVWEAATGKLLFRLDGHSSWVCKLAFSRDGRRLISAAADQTIRFWDTSNWTETQVLRGHTDEIHAVAISEPGQLVASAGKDGDVMLWSADGKSATDGHRRLPEDLNLNQVVPLDQSRVLLLRPGQPPELVDLRRDSVPVSLREIGAATNVLGWFGTNILCHWDGTNQIIVRELRGAEFTQLGAIALDSGTRPAGVAYNATRQLLAWAEESLSTAIYLANLGPPGRRIELRSDVPGLVPFRFSADGNYVAAMTRERAIAAFNHFSEGGNDFAATTDGGDSLRAWKVETGQIVASIGGIIRDAAFAAGGRMMVVAIDKSKNHEIGFYDLARPGRAPQRVPGSSFPWSLAVSPDGGLVASSSGAGQVRLFDPAKGEWVEDLHGHLNGVYGVAFSPDGRRLISASGGREVVKLWDVGTRQELLTLSGAGSLLDVARWSADGDVILAGAPWQAWRAPSWEEIAAAEAKEKAAFKQP